MVNAPHDGREPEQPSEADFEPDAGPPPPNLVPWYRWTFSLPMAVFLAMFIYLAYVSFQTTGDSRFVHVIGAVAAGLLALLLLGLQWWDRYPYRMDHPGHHGRDRRDESMDAPQYPRLHNSRGHSHG